MTVRSFVPCVAQRGDQRLGNAAQAEAADRHQPAVVHDVGKSAALALKKSFFMRDPLVVTARGAYP